MGITWAEPRDVDTDMMPPATVAQATDTTPPPTVTDVMPTDQTSTETRTDMPPVPPIMTDTDTEPQLTVAQPTEDTDTVPPPTMPQDTEESARSRSARRSDLIPLDVIKHLTSNNVLLW